MPLIPALREAEASGYLWVQGQADLWKEFQDSQRDAEKPCLENNNNEIKKRKQNKNAKKQSWAKVYDSSTACGW